jgi:[acyl-carrier-protein] S-malonyltransferase
VKKALLFPGQGSQCVGMGKDFFDTFSALRVLFEEAEDACALPLTKVMFDGDDDTLRQTQYAQPALFLMAASMVRVMEDECGIDVGCVFDCVAGHSLGEYSALYAAKALDFSSVVGLIAARCKAMQTVKNGGMVAILGLTIDEVRRAVHDVNTQGGMCAVSNENAVLQTVVSGQCDSLDHVARHALDQGAKKAVILNVSGPFHCGLMQAAQDAFMPAIKGVQWRTPVCGIVTNVTGRVQTSPDSIRQHLGQQMTCPVLWVDTLRTVAERGVQHCVEMGPGRVLAGLGRKTVPDIETVSVGSVDALMSWAQTIAS